jgi:hypothetical protein
LVTISSSDKKGPTYIACKFPLSPKDSIKAGNPLFTIFSFNLSALSFEDRTCALYTKKSKSDSLNSLKSSLLF